MSDPDEVRDAGFDDWLDAAESGEAYYLACPDGHGSLPPRRVCPDCGATELEEQSLPTTGEIEAATVTHVPTPAFEDDAPYATAIVGFGPVRLTGQVLGADLEGIEPGQTVVVEITTTTTTGERVIGFTRV